MVYLKDLALDLSCLSSIPARCLRSFSAIYVIYTHTPTTQYMYISFHANFNDEQLATVQAMESYVADIREWMLSDKLKLNDDKTEFVIIGTRQQLAKVNIDSLTVGDYTIAPSSEVNWRTLAVGWIIS